MWRHGWAIAERTLRLAGRRGQLAATWLDRVVAAGDECEIEVVWADSWRPGWIREWLAGLGESDTLMRGYVCPDGSMIVVLPTTAPSYAIATDVRGIAAELIVRSERAYGAVLRGTFKRRLRPHRDDLLRGIIKTLGQLPAVHGLTSADVGQLLRSDDRIIRDAALALIPHLPPRARAAS